MRAADTDGGVASAVCLQLPEGHSPSAQRGGLAAGRPGLEMAHSVAEALSFQILRAFSSDLPLTHGDRIVAAKRTAGLQMDLIWLIFGI